ncbi:MAG TPA: PQQ-dependent sugar dehydrogenase, partial [Terriglobia bacterium]|nr:PQQ-dependent sugar dehydrogenase [Terriglobia bacterium]
MMRSRFFVWCVLASIVSAAALSAQQGGRASPPLPPLPQTFETAQQRIRVSAVATGLANPWSLAFLPNGDMLVTERPGRLRIIHEGTL